MKSNSKKQSSKIVRFKEISENLTHQTKPYHQKLLEELSEQRITKMLNPKQNFCSFVVALDILQSAKFLEELSFPMADWIGLVSTLRPKMLKYHHTPYSQLVGQITALCLKQYSIAIEQLEDPWVIILTLRRYLNRYNQDNITLPVCKTSSDHQMIIGDLEYSRQNIYQNYSLHQQNKIARQGQEMVSEVHYLPINFFVRLKGPSTKGGFGSQKFPFFEGFRIVSYIQYNKQTQHFRCIRVTGGDTFIILDGPNVSLWDKTDPKQIILDYVWTNYILHYQKIDPSSQKKYEGNTQLVQVQVTRHFCGGKGSEKGDDKEHEQNVIKKKQQQRMNQYQETLNNKSQRIRTDFRGDIIVNRSINAMKIEIVEKNNLIHSLKFQLQQQRSIHEEEIKFMQKHIEQLLYKLHQCNCKKDLPMEMDRSYQDQLEPIEIKQLQTDKVQIPLIIPQIVRSIQDEQKTNKVVRNIVKERNATLSPKHQQPGPTNKAITQSLIKQKKILFKPLDSINNDNTNNSLDQLKNNCSYQAAFNIFRDSITARVTNINKQQIPGIFEVISEKRGYSKAIKELYQYSNQDIQKSGEQGDPWKILNYLQMKIEQYNPDKYYLPVQICECKRDLNSQGKVFAVEANIEFELSNDEGKFVKRDIYCSTCKTGKSNSCYYPKQFYGRLIYNNKFQGNALIPQIPNVPGHYHQNIIQFDKSSKHFRYIKINGFRKAQIWENGCKKQLNNQQDRKKEIYNRQWTNYVVRYAKYAKTPPQQISNQWDLNRVSLPDIPIGFMGKSSHSRNNEVEQENQGRILSWNVQSLKNKVQKIKNLISQTKPILAVIIEPRGEIKLNKYSTITSIPTQTRNKKINCNILITQSAKYQVIRQQIDYISIFASSNAPFVQPTFIAACYLNCNRISSAVHTKQQVQRFLNDDLEQFKMRYAAHNFDIIISGDFNLTYKEMLNKAQNNDQLYENLREMNRSNYPGGTNLRSKRQIDFIFTNLTCETLQNQIKEVQDSFDHRPIIVKIPVAASNNSIIVPNRITANKIYQEYMQSGESIQDLTQIISSHEEQLLKQIKQIPNWTTRVGNVENAVTEAYNTKYLEKFKYRMNQIVKKRFTLNSAEAFKIMKRTLKYHIFEKRDGGFMNRALYNNKIITGDQLNQKLCDHYKIIHTLTQNTEQTSFPEIITNQDTVKRMMGNVNANKAITYDGITDKLFTIKKCKQQQCNDCVKKINLARQFTTNFNFWNSNIGKKHLIGRLVALNKVYPKTPNISQYRPLVVLSPLAKLLQGFIKSSLNKYNKNINKQQFGFINHVSIEECKFSLYRQINQRKEQKKQTILTFIDLKSAYDRINRKTLLSILKSKSVLNDKQLQMLLYLWTNNKTRIGNQVVQVTNGVIQGSTISPQLFNIYIETLNEQLVKNKISHRLYADDIVIIGDYRDTCKGIETIFEWCNKYDMEVSVAKSGCLIINSSRQFQNNIIKNIQIVNEYKYLGLCMNSKFNVENHLTQINRKLGFIMVKLYPLRKLHNLKMNINLFKTIIIPQYRLCMAQYHYGDADIKKKISQHMKIKLKLFCMMPLNTPNQVVKVLAGNLKEMYEYCIKKTITNLDAHDKGEEPEHQKQNIERGVKNIPMRFTELLKTLYSSNCRLHDNACTNTTHLREEHANILPERMKQLSLTKLIKDYQNTKVRPTIRSIIQDTINIVLDIRKEHGGRRGRRQHTR